MRNAFIFVLCLQISSEYIPFLKHALDYILPLWTGRLHSVILWSYEHVEKLLSLITLKSLLGLGSSCCLLLHLGLAGVCCWCRQLRARVTVPEPLLWQLQRCRARPNQGRSIYGRSSAAPVAPTQLSHCPPLLFHAKTILCTSVGKRVEVLDRGIGVEQMEKLRHEGRVTHERSRNEAAALQCRCLLPICGTFHLRYIDIQ